MTNKEEEDYHGVAPVKTIIKKMKKKYDQDPKGWRIIGSKDDHGNTDTFISKKPNAYWLKSKMLNPYSSLTMGATIHNINKDIDEKVGAKMSPDDMLRLFGMIVPINKNQNIIAAGIEKYSQHHGNYLKKVIKEQDANLGYQLARRVDEEFIKNYPQKKNLYI